MKIRELVPLIDKVVADNSTLITKDEFGRNYLLHVSRERIKDGIFIPRIARSQGSQENRTFLRVNGSPTLIDCINAIANIQTDFSDDWTFAQSNKYYIYAIPFEYALKPNTKLVYDADFTDEMWLFTYSETTRKFPGYLIGTFYVSSYTVIPTKSNTKPENPSHIRNKVFIYNEKNFTFNCQSDEELYVDDKTVAKGYFSFKFNINREDTVKEFEKISKSTFDKGKFLSSSLESFKEVPKWLGW